MTYIRKIAFITTIAAMAFAASVPSAFANSKTSAVNGAAGPLNNFTNNSNTATGHIPNTNSRYYSPNASSQANFFYKIGVRNYERGNFEKAEKAFQGVLRTKGLDAEAYYYLTVISQKQGRQDDAVKYAKAFYGLNK